MFAFHQYMPQGHQQDKSYNNQLWMARQRTGYPQKWVAELLGYRSVSPVSEYERGHTLPNLRSALTLEAIYQTPVSKLFPGLYAQICREVGQAKGRLFPVEKRDAEFRNVRAQLPGPTAIRAATARQRRPRSSPMYES